MVEYVVIPDIEDEDIGEEYTSATVYRVESDGTKVAVGWIGGEPEDNTYYRTYAWIVDVLNEAYQFGWTDARWGKELRGK